MVLSSLAPAAAPPHPSVRQTWCALGRLMAFLEQASATGAGALHLRAADSPQPIGTIMAEGGRVCWATVHGSPITLSQRIGELTGLDRDELDGLFHECQQRGLPLGECLVARGLLEPAQLQGLLRAHIGMSLGTLVKRSMEPDTRWTEWRSVTGKSYYPTYTFTPFEVLSVLFDEDLELHLTRPPLPEEFQAFMDHGAHALVYLIGDREVGLPVAATENLDLEAVEASSLYRTAVSVLAPLSGLETETSDGSQLVFLRNGDGGLAIARRDRHLAVAEVPTPQAFVSLAADFRKRRSRTSSEPEAS